MVFVIDLFCGAGGVTEGIERAKVFGKKGARVIACVNHDALAIKSHRVNHKKTWHFTEDMRTFDVSQLVALVAQYRKKYPGCKIVIWASLECTNHSNAKGGLSRDGDSRTLCDHLDRYILPINPDAVWIENVREFRDHGPIRIKSTYEDQFRCDLKFDEKKQAFVFCPDKTKKKLFFNEWRDRVCSFGYDYEDRDLNSADFGEYTKRIRYFAQFTRPGFPAVWPEPTHTKTPVKGSKLKKWKAVKEVLDFSDEGKSVFNRKKALCKKTMGRIYAGLVKYVAGGEKAFIHQRNNGLPSSKVCNINDPARTLTTTGGNLELVQIKDKAFLSKYFTGDPDSMNISLDTPAHSITTKDHHSLIQTSLLGDSKKVWLDKNYSGPANHQSIEDPAGALTTKDHYSVVQTSFICKYLSNDGKTGVNAGADINEPSPTVTTPNRLGLVKAVKMSSNVWLDKQYTGAANHQSVESPAGALTTNPHYALMHAQHFIDRNFSQGTKHQSVDEPAGALLTVPKMNLVNVVKGKKPFVMDTNFGNTGTSIEDPLPTILACRKQHYLVTPGEEVEGIVVRDSETGEFVIPIYDTDCEYTVKIKEFMALYGISDIKMRMLNTLELKKIQGFPENYYLAGPQDQQKKFIGNSVTPKIPRAMIETTVKALIKQGVPQMKIAA